MSAPIRGGVYLVADEAVSLDDGRSRSVHDERRPFVVLSDLQDRTGTLTADKLREVQMRVLEYLGLIVPVDGHSEQ